MYALVVCTKTDNIPSDRNIKYWLNIATRGQVLLVMLLITIHFISRGREKTIFPKSHGEKFEWKRVRLLFQSKYIFILNFKFHWLTGRKYLFFIKILQTLLSANPIVKSYNKEVWASVISITGENPLWPFMFSNNHSGLLRLNLVSHVVFVFDKCVTPWCNYHAMYNITDLCRVAPCTPCPLTWQYILDIWQIVLEIYI